MLDISKKGESEKESEKAEIPETSTALIEEMVHSAQEDRICSSCRKNDLLLASAV